MGVKINARFATVEDTAEALGVPMRRVRELTKFVDTFRDLKKAGLSNRKALRALKKGTAVDILAVSKNGSEMHESSGPLKRKSAKKTFASRKRRTRAKASKAPR
ncbi:MAG: hypothetical protein WCA00_12010 [Candidatus Acidiferrales bacterium]